ncbi:DUF4328 domain-containing protein [Streptomyces sp. Ag109_O5-10]|uniref:DUF4328 domain-containing protein n=1 Tax=Streptomyces sp. Ag109_O5-10 TaxID=1855349 RepID=UPI00089AABA9|nr:DUF4328 domain-containing protein [Streptomyces sp. Ag109_O5-10]SEE69018.1 protein of unknown function [Streptomyces sp. Ag109_O5-10]
MICARCHHFAAAPGTTLCHRCLGDPPAPVPAAGSTPGLWLRSPVGLGWAAAVLLGAVVAADLFAVWANFLRYDVMGDLVDGETGAAVFLRADRADALVRLAAQAHAVSMVACVIVYLCWFQRVRANAQVFDPLRQSMSPRWAIGGWFVPIASLWFPRRITLDIWDASSPRGAARSHRLVNAWWTLWLVALFAGRLASTESDDDLGVAWDQAVSVELLIAHALDLAAAVLAVLLVVRLTRMQHEKAMAGTAPVAV